MGCVSGYKYDVFISYCRYGNVQKWLLNHFYSKLVTCLIDEGGAKPKVYVDREMRYGVHWPSDLQEALLHSKIMVQLLAPAYFESQWCLAEWRSMMARQRVLGLAGPGAPQGLICSVLYADSDTFPDEAKQTKWWNFKDYAYPDLSYQETREFNYFHGEVAKLARDLVQLLRQVPEWQPGWPVIEKPDPVIMTPPAIPRFE